MKQIFFSAAMALSASVFADVELNNWGTATDIVSFSDCPSYCTGNIDSVSDGGIDLKQSSSQLNNAYGSAKAFAEINGSGFTPVLKAIAGAEAGTGIYAKAYGIQQYTYTGTESTTLELNLNLHGVISGEGRITGQVAVIKGDEIPWTGDMGTLVYELVPYENVLGFESLYIIPGTAENAQTSFLFDVQPGDTFFVRADLNTRGLRGGSADAFNTFTMNFSDDSNLIAASDPEPQPEPEPEPELTGEVVVKYLWQEAYSDGRFSFFERFIIFHAARILGVSVDDIRALKQEVVDESNS